MAEPVPTQEQTKAGKGFYYDAEGNPCARCIVCGTKIELQHEAHYELKAGWRMGVVAEGKVWRWCENCHRNH